MSETHSDPGKYPLILMAEDDEDDRFFMKDVVNVLQWKGGLQFVGDGEELLDYLRNQGKFSNPALSPRPSLILLDLNMPKMDGRQALLEIRTDPLLKDIPIIIWTTSDMEEDRSLCLQAGAQDFRTKPDNFRELEKAVGEMLATWIHP